VAKRASRLVAVVIFGHANATTWIADATVGSQPHGGRHVQKSALVGLPQSAAASLDEAPDAHRLCSFRRAKTLR